MTQNITLTPSIGGAVTCSGGPRQQHYVMHLGDNLYERTEPNITIRLTPSSISFYSNLDDPDVVKRIYLCLGALIMPSQGLDEHLDSTWHLLDYYRDLEALQMDKFKSALVAKPTSISAEFAGFTPRPDFVVGE